MKCGIVQLAICLILFDYRSVACDDHTRIIQDREQKIEENEERMVQTSAIGLQQGLYL